MGMHGSAADFLGLFYYPLLIPSKILLKIKDYKNIVIEGGSPKMAEE